MVKTHQNRASFRAIGNVLRPIRGWINNTNGNNTNQNNNADSNNGGLVDHSTSRIVHDNHLLGNGANIQQQQQNGGRLSPMLTNHQHYSTDFDEDNDDLNFRRSIKARMSLPIVKTSKALPQTNSTASTFTTNGHHQPQQQHHEQLGQEQASLGFVYLQFGTETKRASLPNEITAIDTVHALFVRSFPHQLTMNFFSSPDIKVYIHEATRNVFYELQDVQDIRNQSLLRVYQRDPRNNSLYQPLINNINMPTANTVAIQKQQQQQMMGNGTSNNNNSADIYQQQQHQQRAIAMQPGSREPLYATNDAISLSLAHHDHQYRQQQQQIYQQYSGKIHMPLPPPPPPLPPMQHPSGASTPLHQYYGTTQTIMQTNGYQQQTIPLQQNQQQHMAMQVNASRVNGAYSINDQMGRPMSTTLPPGTHLMPIYGTQANPNSLNSVTVPPPKPQRMIHYNSNNNNVNSRFNSQSSIVSRNGSLPMTISSHIQQQEHMHGNGSMTNGSINQNHHHHQRSNIGNHISSRPLPERPYSVTGTDEHQTSFQSLDRATDFSSLSQNSHLPMHVTTPSSLSNCNQSIYCSSNSNVTNSTTSDSNGNSHNSTSNNTKNDNNNRLASTTTKSKLRSGEPMVDEEARQRVMQLEQKLDSLTDLVQSILSLHGSRSLSVQP